MKIKKIIWDSMVYPFSNLKNVIILGIFCIIPIIGIPFVFGYSFRVIESTLSSHNELPAFDELGEMFVDGLKVLLVGFVYISLPIILFGVFNVATKNAYFSDMYGMLIIMTAVILAIFAILLSSLAFIALGNMAKDDKMASAFKYKEIVEKIIPNR